jgi:hypothetical protein
MMLRGSNAFHQGWFDYLIAAERMSADAAYGAGWEMASETPSVQVVSATIRRMRELGQIIEVPGPLQGSNQGSESPAMSVE